MKIKKKKKLVCTGLTIVTYSFSKYLKKFKINVRLDVNRVEVYTSVWTRILRERIIFGFDDISSIYIHVWLVRINFAFS